MRLGSLLGDIQNAYDRYGFVTLVVSEAIRAFYDYALPLLGDPLPEYARLREARVKKLLPARHRGC